MLKFTKVRIIALLIALSLLTGEAFAIIPLLSYKGITRLFKDPHYSPIVGAAALESGLIHKVDTIKLSDVGNMQRIKDLTLSPNS